MQFKTTTNATPGKAPQAAASGTQLYSTTSKMSATPASTHLDAPALVFSPAVKTNVGPRTVVV